MKTKIILLLPLLLGLRLQAQTITNLTLFTGTNTGIVSFNVATGQVATILYANASLLEIYPPIGNAAPSLTDTDLKSNPRLPVVVGPATIQIRGPLECVHSR